MGIRLVRVESGENKRVRGAGRQQERGRQSKEFKGKRRRGRVGKWRAAWLKQ